MPLLFNYLKLPDGFTGWNASFAQKWNIKCREFQLILHMIAMEINLTITMTYLQLETRIMELHFYYIYHIHTARIMRLHFYCIYIIYI